EDGGLYATAANQGYVPWAVSYEENELMKAEALIRTNNIDAGLQFVDAERDFQNAGLAHVAGTGLTQAQAIEELRKERRVGLFLRGTAFYDARRWGVTEPASTGGGRAGAIVMVPGNLLVPEQGKAELKVKTWRFGVFVGIHQKLSFETASFLQIFLKAYDIFSHACFLTCRMIPVSAKIIDFYKSLEPPSLPKCIEILFPQKN